MLTGTCYLLGCGWYTTELPKIRRAMRPIYVGIGLLRPWRAGARGARGDAVAVDVGVPLPGVLFARKVFRTLHLGGYSVCAGTPLQVLQGVFKGEQMNPHGGR